MLGILRYFSLSVSFPTRAARSYGMDESSCLQSSLSRHAHGTSKYIVLTYLLVYYVNLTSLLLPFSVNYSSVMGRAKRIWYLSPMRAAKVQTSLRIRAVSPEPPLLTHTSSESRGTFRQKARSLAPLNGWACAVKICHDGMLEDTNSLDVAHMVPTFYHNSLCIFSF